MKKTFALLATAAIIGLTAPAFAADDKTTTETSTKVTQDASGNYEKKATEETKSPTETTKNEEKTKTKVDSAGNADTTTTSEQVTDPNGLFNKTKTTTKDEVKHKDGKTTHKHKKKVNGKTVENTTTTAPSDAMAPSAGQ
jgi:hypothetical protein